MQGSFDGGGAGIGEVWSLLRRIEVHSSVRVLWQKLQRKLSQEGNKIQRVHWEVDLSRVKVWAAEDVLLNRVNFEGGERRAFVLA